MGKKFIGLEVVKEEGQITLFDALRREVILKPLSILFFGLGIFYMFFNSKRQTFYDKRLNVVVLTTSKLSFLKLIIAVTIGLVYFIYLFGQVKFGYKIMNFKEEENKTNIIEEILQKREIIVNVNKAGERNLFSEYNRGEAQQLTEHSRITLLSIDKNKKNFV